MKYFKSIFTLLLILVTFIGVSSCNKNDEINISTVDFIGKWSYGSPFESGKYSDIWEFYDDGSFEYYYSNGSDKKYTDPGKYSASGSSLILYWDDGDVWRYKIIEFVDNRAKLMDLEYSESDYQSDDDYEYIYKIEL